MSKLNIFLEIIILNLEFVLKKNKLFINYIKKVSLLIN